MNGFFKYITLDKTIFFGFIASLAILAFSLLYTLIIYPHLPPYLPIFNQMPWGDTRIAEKEYIFLPFSIAFIIFLVNFISSFIIYAKTPFIARVLIVTDFLVCFLMFLFTVRIILLIT